MMLFQIPATPASITYWGFVLLPILMLAGFAVVSKSRLAAAAVSIWAIFAAFLAGSGFLADFSTVPPRVVMLFGPTMIGVLFIAFTGVGRTLSNLPLQFLIGFQSFRIIVELLIYQAVADGVAPPQMTWSGYNFDIITGITALLLIPVANKLPIWLIHIWNVMGAGLLLLVVIVAILSMPTAFQQLEPDNTWVAHFPFVWLPVVLVACAFLGHFVLFRKLITKNTKSEKG